MKTIFTCICIALFTTTSIAQSKVGTIDSEYIINLMPETKLALKKSQAYGIKLDSSFSIKLKEYQTKAETFKKNEKTLGILAKQEDLPYTEQGIQPDVLINPHAFPSRMTVGMMMESVCGKAAALRGKQFDGSAFVGEKMDVVKDIYRNNPDIYGNP